MKLIFRSLIALAYLIAATTAQAGFVINPFWAAQITYLGITHRASGAIAGETTHTLTGVTTPSGANLAIIVTQYRAAASARTCSSPTYNGVASTEVADYQDSGLRAGLCIAWIANPAASGDVVCTVSATVSSGVFCAILFFSGADTVAPVGTLVDDDNGGVNSNTETATGTAGGTGHEILHIQSWANNTAVASSNLTFTDYSEVMDVADTGSDGGQFGIATHHNTSTSLSSTVTTSDDAFRSQGALIELK